MADQHTYKFLPEDKCLSESQLFDYIDGKLAASDMHLLEKHVLSCGFCSDALEGLEKVKSREKVAAFIPLAKGEDEKKEEPKVIPLHPNRKYYALAAGVVLILGITLFMKLSQSEDLSEAKVAELTQSDSIVIMPPPQKDEAAEKNKSLRLDSSPLYRNNNAQSTSDDQRADQALTKGTFTPEPSRNSEAAPMPKAADETVSGRSFDTDGDDFVNVVDANAIAEQGGVDNLKDEAKQEQTVVLAEKKNKMISRPEKESADKKADVQQATVSEDAPMTTVISSGSTLGATSSSPTLVNTAPSSTSYTWSGPTTTGSTTISSNADTTIVVTKPDNELTLSYENGNKMLAAGQATAALALYDEVLKNPSHSHFQDAQWKKSEALLQLKRIDEAKKLLNEIAAKPGKYQTQAKEKLKTL
jgi:hypothetical protein